MIHALSGAPFNFGALGGPPMIPQGHSPQVIAGLTGYIAALAALMGGEAGPTRVDVNALEASLCLMDVVAVAAPNAPEYRSGRMGVNRYAPVYPSTVVETLDGYVGITALTWAQWTAFCKLAGRPEVALIPKYATSGERIFFADEIDEIFLPIFRQQTSAHWVEGGDRMHIPITPAPRPGELPDMPHWRGRGAFAEVDGTGIQAPTLPYRFTFDGVKRPRPSGGPKGPLDGVKVADFTMGWAGPLAARYLADLGALVLKFESKTRPDWWRGLEVTEAADPPLYEFPINFMAVNHGKFGLDVDVTTPEGKAVSRDVVRVADVVIDNQGPGVMEKLGLGPADQRRLSPGVISISMPPFGRGGPLSGLRAYGTTVEHASGMPFVNGEADWAPAMQHFGYGDPIVGLYGAAGAVTALFGRARLGGAEIDQCQVECVLQLNADAIIADQVERVERIGNRRPSEAPACVVPAAGDDAWLSVACDSDAAWRALRGVLDDASLSPDWSLAQRQAHADAIESAIARWSADQDPLDAAMRLQAVGVAAAPVLPAHALWLDDHLLDSGYFAMLTRRYIGDHFVPRSPIRFDGERPALTHPAPTLGEHTAEALAAAGVSRVQASADALG